jgi:hypothetical protein
VSAVKRSASDDRDADQADRFPKEFPVDIKPRSEKAAALLAEALLDM